MSWNSNPFRSKKSGLPKETSIELDSFSAPKPRPVLPAPISAADQKQCRIIYVYPEMLVQPCTNEVTYTVPVLGIKPNQDLENYVGRPNTLEPSDDREYMYKVDLKSKYQSVNCTSKDLMSKLTPQQRQICTWNNILQYGDYPDDWPKNCDKVTTTQFWENFGAQLDDVVVRQAASKEIGDNNLVLLATHHNRMKKLILPLVKPGIYDGYATSCVISLQRNQYQMLFTGYPDKVRKETTRTKGKLEVLTGSSGYKYVCRGVELRHIWTSELIQALNNFFALHPTLTLWIVRHGNAQHNRPLSRGKGSLKRPLDSPLTFLGFQTNQAAAIAVQPYLPERTRLFLVSSYLGRSQHTALQFLRQWVLPCRDIVPTGFQHQTVLMDALSASRLKRFLDETDRSDLKQYATRDDRDDAKRYQALVENYFDPAQLKWVQEFLTRNLEDCDETLGDLGPRLTQKPLDYERLQSLTQHYFFNWTPVANKPEPDRGLEASLMVD